MYRSGIHDSLGCHLCGDQRLKQKTGYYYCLFRENISMGGGVVLKFLNLQLISSIKEELILNLKKKFNCPLLYQIFSNLWRIRGNIDYSQTQLKITSVRGGGIPGKYR